MNDGVMRGKMVFWLRHRTGKSIPSSETGFLCHLGQVASSSLCASIFPSVKVRLYWCFQSTFRSLVAWCCESFDILLWDHFKRICSDRLPAFLEAHQRHSTLIQTFFLLKVRRKRLFPWGFQCTVLCFVCVVVCVFVLGCVRGFFSMV